jgi:hypothetical protein
MLLKVSYDEKEQLREVSGYIDLLHKAETYDAANGTRHFPEFSFLLAVLLAGYKNPGFSEEAEVRLVHLLDFEQSNGGLKLVDVPDDSRPDSAPPLPISFRMRDHTPVAYVDIPFRADGSPNPITEVILGPRNHSLPSGINVFLETIGLPGVTIRTSRASYRG